MREIQELREHNRQMLEQQAKDERDWREQDRVARADEATKVEARHQQDRTDANKRQIYGWGIGIATVAIAQFLGASLDRWWPKPPPPLVPSPVVNVQPAAVTVQPPNITINVPLSDAAKQQRPPIEPKAVDSK